MKNIQLFIFSIVPVMLLGMGCSPASSPVSLDKYENAYAQQQVSSTDDSLNAPAEQPQDQTAAQPQQTNETSSTQDMSSSTNPEAAAPTSTEPVKLAFPGIMPMSQITKKYAHIKTNQGDIVFELLGNEGPRAASNFVYLASNKFYDGIVFHRVVPGFVVQGGDPQTKDPTIPSSRLGIGGPGYMFQDDPVNLDYKEGIVAMANAGPNTNGSQFFIMLADNSLPKQYSIFGRVIKGMDVVKKIAVGDKMLSVTVENSK